MASPAALALVKRSLPSPLRHAVAIGLVSASTAGSEVRAARRENAAAAPVSRAAISWFPVSALIAARMTRQVQTVRLPNGSAGDAATAALAMSWAPPRSPSARATRARTASGSARQVRSPSAVRMKSSRYRLAVSRCPARSSDQARLPAHIPAQGHRGVVRELLAEGADRLSPVSPAERQPAAGHGGEVGA